MQFITIFPMLTTEIENRAWHCSIESRSSRFYHDSSSASSINVGGSDQVSDNMTWINTWQTKLSNLFSMIVGAISYEL